MRAVFFAQAVRWRFVSTFFLPALLLLALLRPCAILSNRSPDALRCTRVNVECCGLPHLL